VVHQVDRGVLAVAEAEQSSERQSPKIANLICGSGCRWVGTGVGTAWQPFINVFGLGLARRGRCLLTRAGAAGGDLFVAAVQVMNTAIAMNWHVAAVHTKAWKTS
jgi:hypothetical protein